MLEARGLTLGYGGSPIITALDLMLAPGRIHALLGPNGSGKSTLLKGLLGLLPAAQGGVWLAGRPLADWGARERARKLAFLPQKPQAPADIRVRQLVMMGRYPHLGLWQRPGQEDHDRVAWAMSRCGIAPLADRPLAALSGGQQQRAWIAMALAQQAESLLLDEPTTYLDWGYQLETLEVLRELNLSQGLGVILSLHELNQACQFAHQLVVLQSGRLVAQGAVGEVLSEPLLAEIFRVRARVHQEADGHYHILAQGSTLAGAGSPSPVSPC